jgi:hypothetical protein
MAVLSTVAAAAHTIPQQRLCEQDSAHCGRGALPHGHQGNPQLAGRIAIGARLLGCRSGVMAPICRAKVRYDQPELPTGFILF